MSLSASQIAALREVELVWPGVNVVIIGAAALGFHYEMTWRQTLDVDLVLAIELADFPGALASRAGWSQHATKEHEFLSPQGAKIDLLPVGPEALKAGNLKWPSGHVMNVVAIDLAFAHACSHTLDDGSDVLVAPPQVISVLKMASYCDRPSDRERDLQDLAHLLDSYVDDDDERRWTDAGHIGNFELAPAFLLGVDVGRLLATDSHRELVTEFLGRLRDDESLPHIHMHTAAPWSTSDSDALSLRLQAFQEGLYRANPS